MTMKRVVAGALGLLAGAALLVGCSDDKSASTASAGDTQASTGGSTAVKVDGKDLADHRIGVIHGRDRDSGSAAGHGVDRAAVTRSGQ